jgi:predicted Rossmann fold nucleotide-binding protein DprA/Smf involved in DNA uptake
VNVRALTDGADATRLAIVGSRAFRNPNAYAIALGHMAIASASLRPDEILSGEADGIDQFAKAFALAFAIPYGEFPPATRSWEGAGGFKERNERIASTCTHLLCVRCADAATYGSGWTADCAERLGRRVVRVTIPVRGLTSTVAGVMA